MTNGRDPALWYESAETLCLLVPDDPGRPADDVAREMVTQIYGATGWTLMATSDPRFDMGVTKAVEDPSLTLVNREQGIVYVRRAAAEDGAEELPPLARHLRFVLLDEGLVRKSATSPIPAPQSAPPGRRAARKTTSKKTKKKKETRA